MGTVVNLAEYRKRREEAEEMARDLDELRKMYRMSREEIALLLHHMFNDEMDFNVSEQNYDLDSFSFTMTISDDEDDEIEWKYGI